MDAKIKRNNVNKIEYTVSPFFLKLLSAFLGNIEREYNNIIRAEIRIKRK
jgi:hypothetical protein